MTYHRIESGRLGEKRAVEFVQRQGYIILERNFKNAIGEMDIIAKDQEYVCFIEVKTRKNDAFGSPLEAVTRNKQKKLIRVAQSYLKLKRLYGCKARFDVVAVMLHQEDERGVELVKNAFEIQ